MIAINALGASPNRIQALQWACSMGMQTIAMIGLRGGESPKIAGQHVDCENHGIVENLHRSLMHILAQNCRNSRFKESEKLGALKF